MLFAGPLGLHYMDGIFSIYAGEYNQPDLIACSHFMINLALLSETVVSYTFYTDSKYWVSSMKNITWIRNHVVVSKSLCNPDGFLDLSLQENS